MTVALILAGWVTVSIVVGPIVGRWLAAAHTEGADDGPAE